MSTLAFLGVGQMGSAILGGVLRADAAAPSDVRVFDVSESRRAQLASELGVRPAASASDAVRGASLVVLAVKPQDLAALLASIEPDALAGVTVLSIAAGKTTSWLEERLPAGTRVVRAMPNLAMRIGEGITALCAGTKAADADLALATSVLSASSQVVRLPESDFDLVTALSGSGPAFFAVLLKAFIDAGADLGLPADAARRLATQTLIGTGKILAASPEPIETFVKAVTSAKGTTEAGLKVLQAAPLRELATDTLRAAAVRSAELSRI